MDQLWLYSRKLASHANGSGFSPIVWDRLCKRMKELKHIRSLVKRYSDC